MTDKKSVLLVEDEPFLAELYQKAFTDRGFVVVLATDGTEALQKLNENPKIGTILLDIMMPKMDGIATLRKFKEEGSPAQKISVYMLTNLGQETIIKEALKVGAAGYIIKSKLTPAQIVDEVEKFLNKETATHSHKSPVKNQIN